MIKNKTTASIILGVGLILFNIIFFALPATKDACFWVSYLFGTIALLSQLGICFLAWDKATSMKSKFMGVPILIVGYRFLVLQLISSFVFLGLSFLPIKMPFYIPLLIDTIIFGVCIILVSAIDVSRDEINRIEEIVEEKVFYIKSLQVDIEMLVSKADNDDLKKALIDLQEKLRYSDPMSNSTLVLLESELNNKVNNLKKNQSLNLITEISELLEERNKKCKLLK